jgi:hypothetical protein
MKRNPSDSEWWCTVMMNIGKILIFAGLLLMIAGILVIVIGILPFNLGKLPGDIYIRRGKFTFFAPIVSMLVISVLLSVVINLVMRFFR